jgi:ABC-type multidrug transport system ATPase subunit
VIHVQNLVKSFGCFRAVDDVTLAVEQGEAVALWGTNGAGKTTVIRCILGLLRYRGTIELAGMNIRKHGKRVRQLIGYVPQELAFHDDMRVIETLHFYARLRGVDGSRPDAVLSEVGLADHGRKRVRELSGGMKQRLALALALLANPPVLLLDEPTSNLDAAAQSSFAGLLREQKAKGKTILFASHKLEEVEVVADRVMVLEDGHEKLTCAADEFADRVGLRCVLQVFVNTDQLDAAVTSLTARGYAAQRNGRSLYVEVPANAKAGAFSVLAEHDIAVRNFEITNDNGNSRIPLAVHHGESTISRSIAGGAS